MDGAAEGAGVGSEVGASGMSQELLLPQYQLVPQAAMPM